MRTNDVPIAQVRKTVQLSVVAASRTTLRPGDVSRMAILFPDRTQLRLAQNSTLQIKEAAQGPDTKRSEERRVGKECA